MEDDISSEACCSFRHAPLDISLLIAASPAATAPWCLAKACAAAFCMSPQAPSLFTLDWCCTSSAERIDGVSIPGLILQEEMELQPPHNGPKWHPQQNFALGHTWQSVHCAREALVLVCLAQQSGPLTLCRASQEGLASLF